jgi:radical SAM protein with 4Fe4S-binding SPASM domain
VARTAAAVRLPFQINSLVSQGTLDDLPAIHALARDLGASRWSLFFLVQVGRGTVLDPISPEACEELMTWLAGLPRKNPLVTTTEAPHYRRVLYERTGRRGGHGAGIRDGNGIMFISHTGDVYPSGFLPLVAGNVRTGNVLDIYRDSDLFRRLREADHFAGRCGTCEFSWECGGSRARAYAATGDPFGEDPLCLTAVTA